MFDNGNSCGVLPKLPFVLGEIGKKNSEISPVLGKNFMNYKISNFIKSLSKFSFYNTTIA